MGMTRAAISTILLLMMVLAASAQRSFRLIAPDKTFEISFPGEPRHEQNISDSGPIHVEAHSYFFETPASNFMLSYVHLTPPPADLKASDAIDSAIGGTLDNVGGKVLDQKSLTMRGRPAKAVIIGVGENTLIDGRFVYVKPRVYQLLVLHRKGATPSFQQQFFDSFSIPN